MDYSAENRDFGWPALPSSMPASARLYALEYRAAQCEKRSMSPTIVRAFADGCREQRSLETSRLGNAARCFSSTLFRPQKNQRSFQDLIEDRHRAEHAEQKRICARNAAIVFSDSRKLRAIADAAEQRRIAAEKAHELREVHLSIFPWERNN